MRQLALDLGPPDALHDTVVSSSNEAAYAAVAAWPRWPDPVLLVRGPHGSGKSHLAGAFAQRLGARLVGGAQLDAVDPLDLARGMVVVDDADRAQERALFHLINAVRTCGTTLLLTAGSRGGERLADLASRLRAVPEAVLLPPDDALLRKVMVMAFQARQLPVDPGVISFLLARVERTLHAVVAMVDAIDRQGLAERRGPTRPLAARVLRSAGSPDADSVP
ncbi:HdaA/DnaA family protein [Acuticoccus sp.]|uniref:HdaA/DnaA family protein n=1 Tax=Acuticoccus sp. TaxID=1904378 RepID=UPI003B524239